MNYFDQGNKNPSLKMNLAMMREQLKKPFWNTFSIPVETEIKKYTSSLVDRCKKDKTYILIGDNNKVLDNSQNKTIEKIGYQSSDQ